MKVLHDKKEVHLCNPTIEEMDETLEQIRSHPDLNDYKIMIDGTDENTTSEWELCLSE